MHSVADARSVYKCVQRDPARYDPKGLVSNAYKLLEQAQLVYTTETPVYNSDGSDVVADGLEKAIHHGQLCVGNIQLK